MESNDGDASGQRPQRNSKELFDIVAKAASSRKLSASSATLSQLNLARLNLHGREDDMNLLKTKLRGLRGTDARRPELLMITGVSGTGKSALVARGLREPAEKMGCAFAGGAFGPISSPLCAFANAMSSLTKFVLGRKDGAERVREDIRDAFDEYDIALLTRVLPGCEGLLSPEGSNDRRRRRRHSVTAVGGKQIISSQQYAIRRLLRIICSNLNGLVLFLDDIHWADLATLDLLKSIAIDQDISSLLLVGAYREDEVTDGHPVTLRLNDIGEMGVEITTIRTINLSSRSVKSLVAEALRMEDDEDPVGTLAATIHKKTEGNAFFVLVFLKSLYDDGLLTFSFGTMKWTWDDDVIKAKLVTENVATVMVNRLKRLKEESRGFLTVASCLGPTFSSVAVKTVLDDMSPQDIRRFSGCPELSPQDFQRLSATVSTESDISVSEPDISSTIGELEEEGLWERDAEDDRFRFAHDRVKLAAFELVPRDKRNDFRGEVGSILSRKLDDEALEECLFEVVNLRNSSLNSISSEGSIEIAQMNLRAGMKASENAAFDAAQGYFQTGHSLLTSQGGWENEYDTMLRLCSEGANACFVNGEFVAMNAFIEEVLSKDIPLSDKFRVYEIRIQSLASANKMHECINTALGVRRQLGLAAPSNKPVTKLTVVKEFIKTRRALKKRSAEEIASLPELNDERIVMGQRLLLHLIPAAYQAQPTLSPVVIMIMLRASLQHGLDASSIVALSGYGAILCILGKLEEGKEMAKAVELILHRPGMKRTKSRALMTTGAFISHWTDPLQSSISLLLEGYQCGLETGDLNSAAYNLSFRCQHLLFSGRPLDSLQDEFETSLAVLSQLKQIPLMNAGRPRLISVKKLRGVSLNQGEPDLDDLIGEAEDTGNTNIRAVCLVYKLNLLVIFQDWESSLKTLLEIGEDIRSAGPGVILAVRFTFLEGLIYFKGAQSTSAWLNKKRWTKRGMGRVKRLRGYVKKGNVNAIHMTHLLTAEYSSLQGDGKRAADQFKAAISVATKNGFLHDKALAHELATLHYHAKGDYYWAKYHFECSEKAYNDWGAQAKVEQLAKRRSELLGDGNRTTMSFSRVMR